MHRGSYDQCPNQCRKCGLYFSTASHRRMHEDTCTGNLFIISHKPINYCEYCGKWISELVFIHKCEDDAF